MADGRHFAQYAEGVGEMARHLGGAFRTDTINVFLAHLYISGAVVEQESGERALHVGDLYAVPPQLLPGEAHYLAMGHIHKPQKVGLNDTYYCGSLLQCDFGEAGQEKGVRIADLKPGRKAQTEFIPLTSIRRLMNLGTHKRGLTLDEIAAQADVVGEAYCKVFVKADRPVPGLVEQVRDLVPTAVDIVVERPEQTGEDHPAIERMTPAEQFAAYYQQLHANEPQPELISLFNRLFEEATGAAD
jgi:exonuclease SbcD